MRTLRMPHLLAAALALTAVLPATSQIVMPPNSQNSTPFHDTSVLKPPAGDRIALIEFEDLSCPACAAAAPLVRAAVEKYQIPYVHRDFPLGGTGEHVWGTAAAITARYLQDKVSPKVAEQFRLDTFAAQRNIISPDDLEKFTQQWFAKHKLQRPFVIDPTGLLKQEVMSDHTLGDRLGVAHTPTIVVVTDKGWIEVAETSDLYAAIDKAKAEVAATAPARSNVRKSATPAK